MQAHGVGAAPLRRQYHLTTKHTHSCAAIQATTISSVTEGVSSPDHPLGPVMLFFTL